MTGPYGLCGICGKRQCPHQPPHAATMTTVLIPRQRGHHHLPHPHRPHLYSANGHGGYEFTVAFVAATTALWILLVAFLAGGVR